MKRRFLGLAVALCLLTPAYGAAQDRTEVVREVVTRLQSQGVDLTGACGALRITNAVALELPGSFKLLRKQGGWRAALQPDGSCVGSKADQDFNGPGFATDYLISVNEGFVGYDLLEDGGGRNIAHWHGPENDGDTIKRNVANFADPIGPVAVPVPVPVPVPPVVGAPAPSPIAGKDYSELLQRILESQVALLDTGNKILIVSQDTNVRVTNLDRTLSQTLGSVGKFVGKYVAPAIAGFITARQLEK